MANDEYLQKVVSEKWNVDYIAPGEDYDGNPCIRVRTTGCGCCSDTILTTDLELAIAVAKVQVELAQKQLAELEKLRVRE